MRSYFSILFAVFLSIGGAASSVTHAELTGYAKRLGYNKPLDPAQLGRLSIWWDNNGKPSSAAQIDDIVNPKTTAKEKNLEKKLKEENALKRISRAVSGRKARKTEKEIAKANREKEAERKRAEEERRKRKEDQKDYIAAEEASRQAKEDVHRLMEELRRLKSTSHTLYSRRGGGGAGGAPMGDDDPVEKLRADLVLAKEKADHAVARLRITQLEIENARLRHDSSYMPARDQGNRGKSADPLKPYFETAAYKKLEERLPANEDTLEGKSAPEEDSVPPLPPRMHEAAPPKSNPVTSRTPLALLEQIRAGKKLKK